MEKSLLHTTPPLCTGGCAKGYADTIKRVVRREEWLVQGLCKASNQGGCVHNP